MPRRTHPDRRRHKALKAMVRRHRDDEQAGQRWTRWPKWSVSEERLMDVPSLVPPA